MGTSVENCIYCIHRMHLYRKSWDRESSDVVRFGRGPLLQGKAMVDWLWLVVFPVGTNLH